MKNSFRRIVIASLLLGIASRAEAQSVPTGAHPRLFMTPANVTAFAAKVAASGTASNALAAICGKTITNPEWYVERGGTDSDAWPGAALACAFSYVTTKNMSHLTQALKFWNASLNDDDKLGDNLGCTANADPNWRTWAANRNGAPPPVILTITHDTGYPIRWYSPYISLVYDWLYNAPGVDDALRKHTRFCLKNWIDYYTSYGYHKDEVGSNYQAGYIVGKAFTAVAIGGEEGADSDRIWKETVEDLFKGNIIGKGLAGASTGVGTPAGVILGGDWGEGWQYGSLSVLEYALATRALEEAGVPLPELDAWINSVIVRYIHGTVPRRDGSWVGGDIEAESIYAGPSRGVLDAVLAGPSSDSAAQWAANMLAVQKPKFNTPFFGDVLADIRTVTPSDYVTQSPAPPLWYLSRGTRALYTRTGWDQDAFWSVFSSSPMLNDDHKHMDASNFVFTRGGDHLVVDMSYYGCRSTLPTNALTAESAGVTGKYSPSQTPWSTAELLWARATAPAVYAARADIAKAFNFSSNPSDIPYAHREWAFLPEGEIVTIDRVRTGAASRNMYVNFHTNTAKSLALKDGLAIGTVGSSRVAIHQVHLTAGGAATLSQPPVGEDCYDGNCNQVRLASDLYTAKVPGPYAVAVHVIDGLGATEDPATVASITDAAYDPDKTNAGVIGAAIFRGMKQSFVVASSAQDGAAGSTLTYSTPGGSAARHIVFDAPEGSGGKSTVATTVSGTRCVVTITAGDGFTGHPLMFQVGPASAGCKATEDTNVAPGVPPPGGGSKPTGGGGGTTVGTGGSGANTGGTTGGATGGGPGTDTGGSGTTPGSGGFGSPLAANLEGGCSCQSIPSPSLGTGGLLLGAFALVGRRRRRPRD